MGSNNLTKAQDEAVDAKINGGHWMTNPDGFTKQWVPYDNTLDVLNALMGGMNGGSSSSSSPLAGAAMANRFEAGMGDAETRLKSLLDNPDSVQQSAAYKFRFGQGEEALNRSLAAKGMLGSGNRLMELTKYGQDMGSQEYDAQFGRLNSLLGNYTQGWNQQHGADTGAAADRYRSDVMRDTSGNSTLAGLFNDFTQNKTTLRGQDLNAASDAVTAANTRRAGDQQFQIGMARYGR